MTDGINRTAEMDVRTDEHLCNFIGLLQQCWLSRLTGPSLSGKKVFMGWGSQSLSAARGYYLQERGGVKMRQESWGGEVRRLHS